MGAYLDGPEVGRMSTVYVLDDMNEPVGRMTSTRSWCCWSSPGDGLPRVREYQGEVLALDLSQIGVRNDHH